jgi:hypothetical protein
MAMKRKPKPLRPDPSGVKAEVRGRLSTRPVRQLGITGPLKKETIKNPKAPKGTGSGASTGSVRVLSKTESMLKREKAMRERSGKLPLYKTVTDSMKTSGNKSYKPSTGNQKLIDATQYIRSKGYTSLRVAEREAANQKGNKPTKITPNKKAEAPKKPATTRRFFTGRGGGMRGGSGGGLYGNMFRR